MNDETVSLLKEQAKLILKLGLNSLESAIVFQSCLKSVNIRCGTRAASLMLEVFIDFDSSL